MGSSVENRKPSGRRGDDRRAEQLPLDGQSDRRAGENRRSGERREPTNGRRQSPRRTRRERRDIQAAP